MDSNILEEKSFNQLTEQELIEWLYDLKQNEQIIIDKDKVQKVVIKHE